MPSFFLSDILNSDCWYVLAGKPNIKIGAQDPHSKAIKIGPHVFTSCGGQTHTENSIPEQGKIASEMPHSLGK